MIKKSRKEELKNKSIEELRVEVVKVRQELAKGRLDLAVRRVKNVKKSKALKKEVALILTLIRSKELEAEVEVPQIKENPPVGQTGRQGKKEK